MVVYTNGTHCVLNLSVAYTYKVKPRINMKQRSARSKLSGASVTTAVNCSPLGHPEHLQGTISFVYSHVTLYRC